MPSVALETSCRASFAAQFGHTPNGVGAFAGIWKGLLDGKGYIVTRFGWVESLKLPVNPLRAPHFCHG